MHASMTQPRAARRAASRSLATLLVLFLGAMPLAACDRAVAADADAVTVFGTPLPFGNGSARVYVVQRDGEPLEVGVALSELSFTGLPADHSPGGMQMPDGHHTYDYVLEMPASNPTPYQFVLLGWNPAGHEPPGIYDKPHFDFHFYTTPLAERNAILPTDPQFAAKAARYPEGDFRPAGYNPLPGAVPMMGAHWVDPTSPELNGQTFTKTFLYGSWDGALTFAEPMITKAFLETKPDVRTPIPTPARFRAAGNYASEYRVYWEPSTKEYRVALTELAQR